jgi:hypothetical protein
MSSSIRLSKLLLGISFALLLPVGAALAEDTPPADPAAAGSPAPAATTTPAATDTAANPATPPAEDPDDKVVCKKEEPMTGSRVGGRKICHTVREWRKQQTGAKEVVDHIQYQGRVSNEDGK